MSKKNDKVVCMFGVPHSVEVAKLGRYGHVQKVYVAGTHYENTKDVTLKLYNEELLWHLKGWCRRVVKRSERAEVEKKRYKVVMLQVVQRVGAPQLTPIDVRSLAALYVAKKTLRLMQLVVPHADPPNYIVGPVKPAHSGALSSVREIYFEEADEGTARLIANFQSPLFDGDMFMSSTGEPAYLYTLQRSTKKKNYRQCIGHQHNPYSADSDRVYSAKAPARREGRRTNTVEPILIPYPGSAHLGH
eukprot:TRINITY_DN627_c0_g2_i1.p1 TRINITY_DN627_c0_g2~~TRINITY_DN627_c0_g2_i1.p1  ORF type:complete len:246 (+),score=62.41 TRINITY_DN627_c0_g2_i1:39-776(+)